MKHRIKVDALSRVEGEGSLRLEIDDDQVRRVRFGLYEPARFFEGVLQGRDFREAPDITARICGICPVAHQITSARALEQACGVEADPAIADLRRLIYCGQWIESHALHIFMLHAPDFLGYADALSMAGQHRALVEAGLTTKKTGNALVALLGGREIHPINQRVGGFYRAPAPSELAVLLPDLEKALQASLAAVDWVAGFAFPDYEGGEVQMALAHPQMYAIDRGRVLKTSAGVEIAVDDFESHVIEDQAAHSTALRAVLKLKPEDSGLTYQVGPLARYSLNHAQLTPLAAKAAERAGLRPPCRNPFKSIVVRAVELVLACEEALRLIKAYQQPQAASFAVPASQGRGAACTEAPRGTLFHSYEINGRGLIKRANIVTPTSQNQRAIENDLGGVAARNLDIPLDELRRLCEQTIRNYDPCISCSTH